MTGLVVDASVWVSAADATDSLSEPSRAFLAAVTERAVAIALPDFAELEVACALARRLRDPERGRGLAAKIVRSPLVTVHPLDASLLERAIDVGTAKLLRAGDAVYTALSEATQSEVVAWDEELVERADALTPLVWTEENAGSAEPEDEAAEGDATAEEPGGG